MTAPGDARAGSRRSGPAGARWWSSIRGAPRPPSVADTHLFIRPGTDALLLLAMIARVFAEKLARPGRLAELTTGSTQVRAAVAPFAPERVAAADGHPRPSDPRARARLRAGAVGRVLRARGRLHAGVRRRRPVARSTCSTSSPATSTAPGGAHVHDARRSTRSALAARLGNGGFARRRSRVRGLPEFGGELPVAALAEEIETAGPGQIRALVTVARQPGALHAQRRRSSSARSRRSTSWSRSTSTSTRPRATRTDPAAAHVAARARALRRRASTSLAVRNTAKYSPALFEPAPGRAPRLGDLPRAHPRLRSRGRRASAPAAPRGGRPARHAPDGSSTSGCATGPYGMLRSRQRLSCRALEASRTASTSARSSRAARTAA